MSGVMVSQSAISKDLNEKAEKRSVLYLERFSRCIEERGILLSTLDRKLHDLFGTKGNSRKLTEEEKNKENLGINVKSFENKIQKIIENEEKQNDWLSSMINKLDEFV